MVSEGDKGAHEEPELVMANLKSLIKTQLDELETLSDGELLAERYERLMRFNSHIGR